MESVYSRFVVLFFAFALAFIPSVVSADSVGDVESIVSVDDSLANRKSSFWKHIGLGLYGNPGQVMPTNAEQRLYIKSKQTVSVAAELLYSSLPSDSSAIDADYNYPSIGFGAKVGFNHAVKLHKPYDEALGMLDEVDYDTRLGNTISFYGTFARPLMRTRYWEADYTLNLGVGYSHRKYNNYNAIDNELIGARWLLFFGAGLHATWHFHKNWGMKFGLDYWHLSSGAMSFPNKGANVIGPSLGFVYTPYYEPIVHRRYLRPETDKYVYVELTGGIGAKALREEFSFCQDKLPREHPDYRKNHYATYATISFQADLMCRYARRWASGAGVDVFYGTYYKRLRTLDELSGYNSPHSPVSVGVAAKHEIYYRNFSLAVAVGYYLYREMGHLAYLTDAPYYERIGLHYTIKGLNHLRIGLNVKAHKGKADFTELVVGMPIRLKRL